MAKKPTRSQLEHDLKLYKQNIDFYLKLKDREQEERYAALRELSAVSARVTELAQENGELLQKVDAYERLLRSNDAACENLSETVRKQDAQIALLKGQLQSVLEHREALLDSLVALRFAYEQHAQGKLG